MAVRMGTTTAPRWNTRRALAWSSAWMSTQSILRVEDSEFSAGPGGCTVAEAITNRFTKYFPLLLDALRSTDPTPMRPAEARAWIRLNSEVPAED
jgi:hypothetical protein